MADESTTTKAVFSLLGPLITLITPDPKFAGIRLSKKQLRLALKELKIAKKMLKEIRKEFSKDGFTDKETEKLDELEAKILARKESLI